MTINVAWAAGPRLYVFADTAVTDGVAPERMSSFGEVAAGVTDSATKILPLGKSMVALVSGGVAGATAFTSFLWEHRDALPVLALLESAAVSTRPHEGPDFSVKVGFIENGTARIALYDSATGVHLLDEGVSWIDGSLPSDAREEVISHLRRAGRYALMPRIAVPLVQGFLQLLAAQHSWFAGSGVGGTFLGGWLDEAGFHWQERTLFMLHGPFGDWAPGREFMIEALDVGVDAVTVEMFDNVLVQWSTFAGDRAVLDPRLQPDEEDWIRRYLDRFEGTYPHTNVPVLVAFSKLERQLAVIRPASQDFRSMGSDGAVDFVVSPWLKGWLERKLLPNGTVAQSSDGVILLVKAIAE